MFDFKRWIAALSATVITLCTLTTISFPIHAGIEESQWQSVTTAVAADTANDTPTTYTISSLGN